ncbi:MAG: hypothetical protein KAR19_03805 [Bacteroidales bacterium]|nr:hypothetical protein [Bacteroidales bacterium]
MSNKKLGIETLKELAKAVVELGEDIEEKREDGKITVGEGLSIAFGTMPDAYSIARKGRLLKAEYQDLDDNEREELVQYVVDELDLEHDDAEVKIEAGVKLMASFDEFLATFRKKEAA